MKLPARPALLFSGLLLLSFLCLMLPAPLRADTVYTYTGNDYTSCSGTYASSGTTCAGPFALSITFATSLAGSQLDNLVFGSTGDITPDITSFSVSDGAGLSITNADADAFFDFDIGTAADGSILKWGIVITSQSAPPYEIVQTISDFPDVMDSSGNTGTEGQFLGRGLNSDDSGKWVTSSVVTTPEPSTGLLLALGLLGLVATRLRRHLLRPSGLTP